MPGTSYLTIKDCRPYDLRELAQSKNSHKLAGSQDLNVYSYRKIELVELCSIFLGDRWAKAYLVCVLANLYGTLWVFSTVFGKTLSTYMVHVGVTDSFSQYTLSLFILLVLVIPGSLLDFKDQVSSA